MKVQRLQPSHAHTYRSQEDGKGQHAVRRKHKKSCGMDKAPGAALLFACFEKIHGARTNGQKGWLTDSLGHEMHMPDGQKCWTAVVLHLKIPGAKAFQSTKKTLAKQWTQSQQWTHEHRGCMQSSTCMQCGRCMQYSRSMQCILQGDMHKAQYESRSKHIHLKPRQLAFTTQRHLLSSCPPFPSSHMHR